MKYVLAIVLLLIALPIIFGIVQMILGAAMAAVKLLIGLGIVALIAVVILRLLNPMPR